MSMLVLYFKIPNAHVNRIMLTCQNRPDSILPDTGAFESFAMATKIVTERCQEEQMEQMSHGMQMSSQIKKRKFKSSDEMASLSEFYPIIPGDVMSVKEILPGPKFPRHRTWEVLRETLSNDELHERDQWTMFGNEVEKLEIGVIRNQRVVRERVDRFALRREVSDRHTKD
ncbi:myomesin-3 [Labeo rohita]|uniref:Myomesin-3 n=1 Tax=Labeo rohita TaxID=84645 RepID=A0A498ND41_LABRO|nr:myomesin-3 [Labeo rohita]